MSRNVILLMLAAWLVLPPPTLAAPTLYGQAHVSVDWVDDGQDDNVAVSNNNSRVGLKGAEDLGSDLQAVYQIEWGVDLADNDDDDDLGFQRDRYVGLHGPAWGTLFYGRHGTPMKALGREVDLFWHSQMGQNRSITAIGSGAGPGFDLIMPNTIGYRSPRIAGVEAFAVYVPDHDLAVNSPGADDDNQDAISAAITYKNTERAAGPVYGGLAFESHQVPKAFDAAEIRREKALRAVAAIGQQGFTFTGFAQYTIDEGFIRHNDRFSYGLGVAFEEAYNTFKAQWYRAQTSNEFNENGGWLLAGGVDHAFSKTTSTYLVVAYLRPDVRAQRNQAGFEFDTGLDLGAEGHFETHALAVDDSGDAERQIGLSMGMRVLF